MADPYWHPLALPWLGGVVLSLGIEQLLKPRPALLGRPAAAFLLHMGVWTLFFSVELALLQRPYFVSGHMLAALVLLVFVNNAKFRALREPFLYTDFDYFIDALRFPRLYLPFLGLWRSLLVIAALALVVYFGISAEPSLLAVLDGGEFAAALLALACLGGGMLWLGARMPCPVTLDPVRDVQSLGLAGSLWCYGREELACGPLTTGSQIFAGGAARQKASLPHLVAIQSESFFDARRLHAGIRPEVLGQFDAMRRAAVQHGRLSVPAWGANTARTEFSFLAGLGPAALGIHRFNPYQKLVRERVPTIASFLQQSGYRTLCVHPHPARFYSRDRVIPLLGFDKLLDIEEFSGAMRFGPYVGDVAVAEKIRDLLGSANQPTFVYAITMENHGPLHLEQAALGDTERLYAASPPHGYDDLTIYLRHLANADRMLGMLRASIEASPRDGWLCFYGDHVPIMPEVYQRTGFADGQTEYLIWGKGRGHAAATPTGLEVENLGAAFLRQSGLLPETRS